MLISLIAGAASAGSILVAVEDLEPGEAIGRHQVETVEVVPEHHSDTALSGDLSEAVGRVPRHWVARGAVLNEAQLLPRGTQAGPRGLIPEGFEIVRISLPQAYDIPDASNRADVWVWLQDRVCVAADAALVVAVSGVDGVATTARASAKGGTLVAYLAVSTQSAHWIRVTERPPILALRNPTDTAAGRGGRCDQ